MLKKRFLLLVETVAILLAGLTISSFSIHALPPSLATSGGYSQGYPKVAMLAQAQTRYHLDCFRRHYKFTESTSQKYDASNYYLKVS